MRLMGVRVDRIILFVSDGFSYLSPVGFLSIWLVVGLSVWKGGFFSWLVEAGIGFGLIFGALIGLVLAANTGVDRSQCQESSATAAMFGDRQEDVPRYVSACRPSTVSAPGMLVPGALDR